MKKQSWLVPYKANKRNYEDIGLDGYALEHDRGFGGDKLYRVCRRVEGGFVRVLANHSREAAGPFYRRADALKFAREYFAYEHPEQLDALNHADGGIR